ncbi:hypothetical protein VP01_2905g1, partial [Puccinia sorghi]
HNPKPPTRGFWLWSWKGYSMRKHADNSVGEKHKFDIEETHQYQQLITSFQKFHNEETSSWLGTLLGNIGSVSKPLTKEVLGGESYPNKIFIRAFFNYCGMEEASGKFYAFVFSHCSETWSFQFIFNWENMSLFEISNYQPSIFFDTPQILFPHQEHNMTPVYDEAVRNGKQGYKR